MNMTKNNAIISSNSFRWNVLIAFGVAVPLITAEGVPTAVGNGAYWRELPQALPYEATIPLIYRMKWIEEDASSPTMPQIIPLRCDGIQMQPFCNVREQLLRLYQLHTDEFSHFKTSYNIDFIRKSIRTLHSNPRTKRALDFIGDGLAWCCSVATQHKLDDLVTEHHKAEQHIERLTMGLDESLRDISSISSAFTAYQSNLDQTFRETQQQINTIHKVGINLSHELSGMNDINLQNVLFIFENFKRVISLTRITTSLSIINSCTQHQIPSVMLQPRIFQSDLRKLENTIHRSEKQLAISTTEVLRYYHLPLCDCTFTETHIVINVRIPITSMHYDWKLYQLIPISFAWYQETCTLSIPAPFVAVAYNATPQIVTAISGTSSHQCRPFEDKLCYIPRFSADDSLGPLCIIKLYTGSTVEDLANHCKLTCHHSTSLSITELEESVYSLIHPSPETRISCSTSLSKLPDNVPRSIGALKIHLPCNCKLLWDDKILIPERFPCTYNSPHPVAMVHAIPAIWSSMKSFSFNLQHQHHPPTYNNMSECLNPHWHLTIPHINLTSVRDKAKTMEEMIYDVKTHSYGEFYGFSHDALLLLWNTVLSTLLLYLLLRLHMTPVILPAPVAAISTDAPLHHNLLLYVTVTIFTLFLTICCWWLWNSIRRRPGISQSISGTATWSNLPAAASMKREQKRSPGCTIHIRSTEDLKTLFEGERITGIIVDDPTSSS